MAVAAKKTKDPVLEQMQQLRDEALAVVHALEKELLKARAKLAQIEAGLAGWTTGFDPKTFRNDLKGMGTTEAAELVLVEAGELLTTNEIVEQLTARGWTTTSARPVPNVYACLFNAKDRFVRKGDKWGLKKAGGK